MTKLQSALLATATFALGAVAVSALHAQSNAPYYQVAGINVTDQAGYEASGVDKVRDAIKAAGGKVIAGGYNKAVAIDSDIPAPNRFLIFMYPSKEVADKVCFLDVGVICEEGPPEQIFSSPTEPRTREFLARVIEAGRL